MAEFEYEDLLPIGPDHTEYRLLTTDGVRTVEGPGGRTFLEVDREALRTLTDEAMHDIAHYLRPAHLAQLRRIIDDPEASNNDRFVALDLLKNANIAAAGALPMCQDTGTAIVMGKRGQHVLTAGGDEEAIAHGVFDAYTRLNLRYSQMAPVTTGTRRTPVRTSRRRSSYADTAPGHEAYKFLFMAKGGGSANKSFLYQETKAVLNPERMLAFLDEKLRSLGTAACPPYHLAIVIGGTSAEFALKTAKYASAKYLDELPTTGSAATGRGFRDTDLEERVLELTRNFGIGAQFGGKYFCHDVRVVRPAMAPSPVAIAVSCSADRQALGKITPEGLPGGPRARPGPLPARDDARAPRRRGGRVRRGRRPHRPQPADGRDPRRADEVPRQDPACSPARSSSPATSPTRRSRSASTRASRCRSTSGTTPSTTPAPPRPPRATRAAPSARRQPGAWTPTSSSSRPRRLDGDAGQGQPLQAGDRRVQRPRGFYLGSIGGPAARLAQDCIRSVEVIEYPELGMEAVWKIEVEDFPAFIVVDDKGNDFFAETAKPMAMSIPSGRGCSHERRDGSLAERRARLDDLLAPTGHSRTRSRSAASTASPTPASPS